MSLTFEEILDITLVDIDLRREIDKLFNSCYNVGSSYYSITSRSKVNMSAAKYYIGRCGNVLCSMFMTVVGEGGRVKMFNSCTLSEYRNKKIMMGLLNYFISSNKSSSGIFEFNIMKSGENLIGAVNNFNELLTSNGLGVLKQTGETEYLYNFTIENKV